jgi:hypothetical protein
MSVLSGISLPRIRRERIEHNKDMAKFKAALAKTERSKRRFLKVLEAVREQANSAIRIDDRRYQIGDQLVVLTKVQEEVLVALIERGGVATLSELREDTEVENAYKHLQNIIAEHPIMAKVLQCPGKKGNGSYRTAIRLAVKK